MWIPHAHVQQFRTVRLFPSERYRHEKNPRQSAEVDRDRSGHPGDHPRRGVQLDQFGPHVVQFQLVEQLQRGGGCSVPRSGRTVLRRRSSRLFRGSVSLFQRSSALWGSGSVFRRRVVRFGGHLGGQQRTDRSENEEGRHRLLHSQGHPEPL